MRNLKPHFTEVITGNSSKAGRIERDFRHQRRITRQIQWSPSLFDVYDAVQFYMTRWKQHLEWGRLQQRIETRRANAK